jgi:hypothetical protein
MMSAASDEYLPQYTSVSTALEESPEDSDLLQYAAPL